MMEFLFLVFFVAFFNMTSAAEMPSSKKVMNGHRLDDFNNFEKKWKLVTVRYRKDTGEMRFTYANSLAYKTLKAGRIDYPNGAVFGKIGFKTTEDQSFTSSVIPTQSRRYQFMIRDNKKYKENNGWDYALFDQDGFTFPEEPKNQVSACAACHNAVPERGYVFSQLINLHPGYHKEKVEPSFRKLYFETISVSKLPQNIANLIPSNIKEVRSLTGELRTKLFQGTLEEIRPSLYLEAATSKLPAILFIPEGNRFSLVLPENLDVECNENEKKGIFMHSIYTTLDKNDGTQELHFCFTN